MLSLFKKNSKTPPTPPRELETITTEETVALEHKASGKVYKFSIGKTSSGTYFALTDPEQRPKFCFEADDRDDAYQKGVDAINFYMENVLANEY
jgi:hypothetical protein